MTAYGIILEQDNMDLNEEEMHLISNQAYKGKCAPVFSIIDQIEDILDEQKKWEMDELSYNLYRKDVRRIKYIKNKEEKQLIERIQEGDSEAKEQLVLANLGLVIHIARKYQNCGLPLNDLVSEGNIGLINASENIKDLGIPFKSYAVWYVKNSIIGAINKYGCAVRDKSKILSVYNKIQKYINEIQLLYGYQPSVDEIIEAVDVPENRVYNILSTIRSVISLDGIFERISDYDLSDDIVNHAISDFPDNPSYEVDENFYYESLRIDIYNTLHIFEKRERDILKMCFGIDDNEWNLNEIAAKIGITRERVRQIVERSIRKMRMNKNSHLLRKYLG